MATITLEAIDRQSIRALVEKHSLEIRSVARSKGNVYQTSLDQQDQINEFHNSLSESDATFFLKIYNEEMEANIQKTNDDAAKLNIEAARLNSEADAIVARTNARLNSESAAGAAIGKIVGFVVLTFVCFIIIRYLINVL